jgi:ADP-heptose:LPS heptosyltransferase
MIIESQIAEVIVCGTIADQQYADVTDLRGTLDLTELVHVAKGGSLIVSNDSAPLHLASALNRPAIGLFGPTNPLRYGPYPRGESHGLTLSAPSGKIEEIGIEQVFLKVREMI